MHTVHSGLTIAARVDNKEVDKLTNFLRKLQQENGLDFDRSASTLYASIVLLPSQEYHKETLPDTLILFTSFSGPFKKHLEELITYCGATLRELFGHCIGFPKDGDSSDQALKKFILKHRHTSTFYSGLHGICATDIYREDLLRKEIVLYINEGQKRNEFDGLQPAQIKERIQNHIKSKGAQYEWAFTPHSRTVEDFWVLYGKAIALGAVLLLLLSLPVLYLIFRNQFFFILSLLLCGIILFAVGTVLYIESGIHKVAPRVPDEKMRMISASQLNPIVNEMTAAGPVKKGWLRRLIFITLLKVVACFHGTLKIPTVCTARWVALDAGKRLIFISNFTNQSYSYVRDFIDSRSSAKGINLLFGHGEGYPRTKWLRWKGNIENPEGFMNVLHQNQHVTQYWFAPFRNLTVDIIINNRRIRNGLFSKTNPDELQKWLNLL